MPGGFIPSGILLLLEASSTKLAGRMEQRQNFGDERQRAWCVHCGNSEPRTRDHVPSKVLLDNPLPSNLPVVGTCERCNVGVSRDEEYVACLLECTVVGSVSETDTRREKVKQCLRRSKKLRERLSRSQTRIGGRSYFAPEMSRVHNVVLKLARGHSIFDLNEPHWEEPRHLMISPLSEMTVEQRTEFETLPSELELWPEVGSRAMQRFILGTPGASPWVVVQPNRYRYLATLDDGLLVRIVLSEYLAAEVRW